MPTMRLDRRRGDALRPRKAAYDIRGRDLQGFGIRVRPSGREIRFVHVRCDGERVRRTVGDAGAVAASEARTRAAEPVAALRRDGAVPEDTVFEAVAGEAPAHHARILPRFRGRPVAGITRRDVRAWFVSPERPWRAARRARLKPATRPVGDGALDRRFPTAWFAAIHLIVTAGNGLPSVERGRRSEVRQAMARTMKRIMAVMARCEGDKPLSVQMGMDDAHLSSVRSGGRRGPGTPGRTTPFVAGPDRPQGRPRKVRPAPAAMAATSSGP